MRKFSLMIVALALAATTILTGASGASAAPCTYNGCLNKDPSTTGCDTLDDRTINRAVATGEETIEMRYSGGCHAYWARIRLAGVSWDANGCTYGNRLKLRARISSQKLVDGQWRGLETAASTWKSCGSDWHGDTGTGWSVMLGAAISSTIRFRVCQERYYSPPELTPCGDWHIG